MKYDGPERRGDHFCVNHEIIHGNGKPGLVENVKDIKLTLDGDPDKGFVGMKQHQQTIKSDVSEIKEDLKPLRPFLKPYIFYPLLTLSVLACAKVLGIANLLQIFSFFGVKP